MYYQLESWREIWIWDFRHHMCKIWTCQSIGSVSKANQPLWQYPLLVDWPVNIGILCCSSCSFKLLPKKLLEWKLYRDMGEAEAKSRKTGDWNKLASVQLIYEANASWSATVLLSSITLSLNYYIITNIILFYSSPSP